MELCAYGIGEYKGTFNVRIKPTLHRKLAMIALESGESLNQTVEKAIQTYVNSYTQNEVIIKEAVSKLLDEYNRNYAGNLQRGISMVASFMPNMVKGKKNNINMAYKQ